MEKLTLPRLLQRLQLLALQLATTPSRQPPHQQQQQQQQQQQHPHPHGCHLMAMQLCQAMLLYGCLLLLHASVSVSASASHTALALNLSSAIDLNQLKHHPEQQQQQQQPEYPQTAQQPQQPQRAQKRDAANVPDDDYDGSYPDDIDELDALLNNKSAKGKYIGAPCNELKCDVKLLHVACDKETQTCTCERNYPVQLGPIKGCAKPKKLGDQCFYDETCTYNDENSLCVQVRHNAMCQCASGFHSVSYTKPTRRVFCTPDLSELSSDLPTLLGVSTGIAVLAGLICMVLHLFSKTKYPRHRNYGDASIPPPILYSSDTGIPLTVHSARPSSRSSIRSTGSIGSFGQRRASVGGQASGAAGGAGGGGGGGVAGGGGGGSGGGGGGGGGSKGILVSTSRTGAARSAAILLISCHIAAVSKQNSRASSRHTSGAGCSQHSRDDLDENSGGGGGGSASGCRSCESSLSMNRQLQKQLNHQRHLLSFELSPARSKNQDRFRTLLGMNGIDNNYRTHDDDDDDYGPHSIDPSAVPAHTHAQAHAHGHDSDVHGGVGGGGGASGAAAGYSYGYGYGYSDADTYGDTNGTDGAELHHLQIGALPTPASETPRFAVIQLNHQSFSRSSFNRSTSTSFVAAVLHPYPHHRHLFMLHLSVSATTKQLQTSQWKLILNYVSVLSVLLLHPPQTLSLSLCLHQLEILVHPSSRRPSLASVHSTSSSVRSYSMMRFEKEAQQKEIRQEMKLRLARLQQQQHLTQNKPQIVIGEALLQHGALGRVTIPTPSPLTPNSLDELLPSLDENQEYPPRLEGTYKQLVQPGTSACGGGGAGALRAAAAQSSPASANGYHGPCSSSTEAL